MGSPSENPHQANLMSHVPTPAKVLFIDDDAGIRRAFKRVLTTRGFETDTACSGDEALTMAELQQYPVVVTDLRMPGMDGLTLIERMRVLQPNAAFVVITG